MLDRHRLTVTICLTILVACLLGLVLIDDDEHAAPHRSCPTVHVTPLNPVTCQPYVTPGVATIPGTNDSRRSAQKPKANAPAAKAPAPGPAAPKPPSVSLRK